MEFSFLFNFSHGQETRAELFDQSSTVYIFIVSISDSVEKKNYSE